MSRETKLKAIEEKLVAAIESCPTNQCLMDNPKVMALMEKRDELLGLTPDDDDDDEDDDDEEDDEDDEDDEDPE